MWIKFYNFNFGKTSNGYILTYKLSSPANSQLSWILCGKFPRRVEIAWSRREGLLCWDEDQGWRVLSRSNGKFKARTQTLPICPNLSETHHRSICFHKLITVDPTRCSFTFTSTANEWHQLNRLPNPLDFYKTALRQTLVLKHFPFSRSIARKSHIIDYISVQIYQNIFVLGSHHSWT